MTTGHRPRLPAGTRERPMRHVSMMLPQDDPPYRKRHEQRKERWIELAKRHEALEMAKKDAELEYQMGELFKKMRADKPKPKSWWENFR